MLGRVQMVGGRGGGDGGGGGGASLAQAQRCGWNENSLTGKLWKTNPNQKIWRPATVLRAGTGRFSPPSWKSWRARVNLQQNYL